MPSLDDMKTSLEDARFFHECLDRIVRGPEDQQDLAVIRRYFRAYLHCWKTVLHFVRAAKGLEGSKNDEKWVDWCERWQQQRRLNTEEVQVFEHLRRTRDHDTHVGMIMVVGEIAAGLFPIVMFVPAKSSNSRKELISCTNMGLDLCARLIQDHDTLT